MDDPPFARIAAIVSQVSADLIPSALELALEAIVAYGIEMPTEEPPQPANIHLEAMRSDLHLRSWLHTEAEPAEVWELLDAMRKLSRRLRQASDDDAGALAIARDLVANQSPANVLRVALREASNN